MSKQEVVMVPFIGIDLLAVQVDGSVYVAIKPISDDLGLDWEGQRQRVQRDRTLKTCTCLIKVQIGGQIREVLCLKLDYVSGWLFGIDEDRVRPELQDKIIKYKLECYEVLHDHFYTKKQSFHPKPNLPQLPAPQQKLVAEWTNQLGGDQMIYELATNYVARWHARGDELKRVVQNGRVYFDVVPRRLSETKQ